MLAAVAKRAGVNEVAVYDVDKSFPSAEGINFSAQRQNMGRFLEGVNDRGHPAWRKIANVLETFKPDVVGITTMTIQYASALKVAELVKGWNKDCVVIMGGAHASVMPRGMIEWPHTDLVVRGEGEEAFLEILSRINSGKGDYSNIPGVLTKNDHREMGESPQEIEDLDALPFPDRSSLMNVERFSAEDMGLMITSRGCPYRCSYCSNFSRKTRFRSVQNVIEEIIEVQRQYDTVQFMFKDDAFTLDRKRVEGFCRNIVRSRIKMVWECATRLDLIDNDMIRLMKKAGCNRIGVGIESGDDEMLKVYDKRLDKDQMRRGAKILNDSRIFWTGYFMMGLPMEREEQIRQTLHFMKEIKPSYAALGVYKPYPGTKLFEMAKDLGLVESDPSNETFFKTNPVDYFLRDAHHRCAYISEERLEGLTTSVTGEFETHNRKMNNVMKRAISRRKLYRHDPRSLVTDINRALRWFSGN